jgi:putative nucleotidyltransferase with HDIG domain
MNIDDEIRQMAAASHDPYRAQVALQAFLAAAHRLEDDPIEKQRLHELAEDIDTSISTYDRTLASLDRGDCDPLQILDLCVEATDLTDPDGLLADLLKHQLTDPSPVTLQGRVAQVRAHRAILKAAYRNVPAAPLPGLRVTSADLERVLMVAMAGKDPHTHRHLVRISRLAVLLGQQLGMTATQLEAARLGGLFHDIGKLALSDAILTKSGPLTEEECRAIQEHTERGALIVEELPEFFDQAPNSVKSLLAQETMSGIRYHHEKYNGMGYPGGLAGDGIPQVARVIAVADCFDAMTSTRSYRAARSAQDALREIRRYSGTEFDPQMVEAFLMVYDTNRDQIDELIRSENAVQDLTPPEPATPDHHFLG